MRGFERTVGHYRYLFSDARISIGTPGEADVEFIMPSKYGTISLYVEIKAGKSDLSKEQKQFKKLIQRMNGFYMVGRSSDQVISEIEKYLEKINYERVKNEN